MRSISPPIAFVSNTSCIVSAGVSSMGISGETPVANTTRSSPPIAATVSSTIRVQSSGFRTSPTTTTPPPASATALSNLSRLRAENATDAPAPTASMAMRRPIPVEEPTTSTRAPDRSAAIRSTPDIPRHRYRVLRDCITYPK